MDEIVDEILDETGDIIINETVDEILNERGDETVNEIVDEIVDETVGETGEMFCVLSWNIRLVALKCDSIYNYCEISDSWSSFL